MIDKKPTTLWAVFSLVCSVLGCLASLAFLVFEERYREMAHRSAGVGAIWASAHVMLAAALCLLGVLFGVVALARIWSADCGGRGMTWAGIFLGCLPLASAVIVFLMSNADSNPLR